MNDAFLCRYANQDIRMLRGVQSLTEDEKIVLVQCTAEWLRREVEPLAVEPEQIPPELA